MTIVIPQIADKIPTQCVLVRLHPLDFRNPMQLFTNNRLYAKILKEWLREIPTVFLILNSLLAFKYLKKSGPNLGEQSIFCPRVRNLLS